MNDDARRRTTRHIFFVALVLHLLAIAFLLVPSDDINKISRDSYWYDLGGQRKAEAYARGEIVWSNWIDEAWWEIIGVIYLVFGPLLVLVSLMNALVASGSALLVYRITLVSFRSHPVAAAAGYMYAVFPSIVYYTSLPLKEALAGFGILAIAYGLMQFITKSETRFRSWAWMLGGLAIVTGLRVYLVPIFCFCIALSIFTPRLNRGLAGIFQFVVVAAMLGVGAIAVIETTGIEIDKESEMFRYFDVDNLNSIRQSLNRGNTELYDSDDEAAFTGNPIEDSWRFIKGVFFFIFTINPAEVNKTRQLAAVPEIAFFLYCIPFVYYGVVHGWRNYPNQILPLIMFGLVIVIVYGSAATNAGAMYRWRIQALPFLFIIVSYGAAARKKGLLFNWLVRMGYPAYRPWARPLLAARPPLGFDEPVEPVKDVPTKSSSNGKPHSHAAKR